MSLSPWGVLLVAVLTVGGERAPKPVTASSKRGPASRNVEKPERRRISFVDFLIQDRTAFEGKNTSSFALVDIELAGLESKIRIERSHHGHRFASVTAVNPVASCDHPAWKRILRELTRHLGPESKQVAAPTFNGGEVRSLLASWPVEEGAIVAHCLEIKPLGADVPRWVKLSVTRFY